MAALNGSCAEVRILCERVQGACRSGREAYVTSRASTASSPLATPGTVTGQSSGRDLMRRSSGSLRQRRRWSRVKHSIFCSRSRVMDPPSVVEFRPSRQFLPQLSIRTGRRAGRSSTSLRHVVFRRTSGSSTSHGACDAAFARLHTRPVIRITTTVVIAASGTNYCLNNLHTGSARVTPCSGLPRRLRRHALRPNRTCANRTPFLPRPLPLQG